MSDQEHPGEWCPEGWQRDTFLHREHSHAFYVIDRGGSKSALPSVLLMHEFPGISTDLVQLADAPARDIRIVVLSILAVTVLLRRVTQSSKHACDARYMPWLCTGPVQQWVVVIPSSCGR
jgi:hypothetical protein